MFANPGRRDEERDLADAEDQMVVKFDADTRNVTSDWLHFLLCFAHQLHHLEEGPVILRLFEFRRERRSGRFAWGGCKIAPV